MHDNKTENCVDITEALRGMKFASGSNLGTFLAFLDFFFFLIFGSTLSNSARRTRWTPADCSALDSITPR